jgi:hypothetical protein
LIGLTIKKPADAGFLLLCEINRRATKTRQNCIAYREPLLHSLFPNQRYHHKRRTKLKCQANPNNEFLGAKQSGQCVWACKRESQASGRYACRVSTPSTRSAQDHPKYGGDQGQSNNLKIVTNIWHKRYRLGNVKPQGANISTDSLEVHIQSQGAA